VVQFFDESRRPTPAVSPRAEGGRIPPHNLEAEESLLGAMMLSRDAIMSAIEHHIDPREFYKPAHGHIYEAAFDLHARGEPVDPVTMAEELRRKGLLDAIGGKAALLRIQAATPASANAAYYAQIVSELALLRKLISVAGDIAEMSYSGTDDVTDTLDRAETMVFDVAERRVSDSLTSLYPALEATMDQLEQLYDRDSHLIGVPTGYREVDEILLGLQPSNLIIVAARPGQGKTSWALGAALHCALEARKPVLFFSMEMSHLDLTKRLLASEARIDSRALQTGRIAEHEWPKLNQAVGRLAEAPFFIDDNPHCTVMEMRAKARRTRQRYGDLGLIVIDYLQLMSSSKKVESRQVEVSELSRGLKILARELDVPVVCLAQLNRQVEYRNDKRPLLADLRESGCLTASTRITRADTNAEVTLGSLVESGERDIPVWTLDEHYRLTRGTMTHAFASGIKETFELRFASGRTVEASANHPFLTLDGWRPVDQLSAGDRLATARKICSAATPAPISDPQLVLLAHLIGDGRTSARDALRYTTSEPLERGRRDPVAAWLDGVGVFNLRSGERFVPDVVMTGDERQLALFLRHLWATDGSITKARSKAVRVRYASTSQRLAIDVQSLLLRLDIRSRVREVPAGRGRAGYTVDVSGRDDQLRFLTVVGCHGERGSIVDELIRDFETRSPNPNVDVIPAAVWDYVRAKLLPELGVSGRELAARLDMRYCGTALYKSGVSRSRMRRLAAALPDRWLADLADSDVFWDELVEVKALGEQPVFDATVLGTHNFLANGVVAHNSIEQDADVVMFIYRDEYYNSESENRGTAEIIVAKHRSGPTGTARLAFLDKYTKFANMARE
jgi:replicative DNA helicase